MRKHTQKPQPNRRRFRIWTKDRLSAGFADGLDGVEQEPTGSGTLLTGTFVDQAQLYGVLDQLRRLGIDVERFETFLEG